MRTSHHLNPTLALLMLLGGACSSTTANAPGSGSAGASSLGTGGSSITPSGGQASTGEAGRAGSGGASASGGISGSSGAQSIGGASDASSATASAGTSSQGGAGSGGTSRASTGTQDTGGKGGSGGGMGVDAGIDARGTGGNSAGGASSTRAPMDAGGDTSGAGGSGGTSPGCGAGKTTSTCGKSGGTKCTLTSNSKTREYYLMLPTGYNPAKPYPVVVMLHGMIATAEMAISWFNGIPKDMPEAIYIAPQGLKHKETGGGANGNEVTGWANVDGEDIQFMRDLVAAAGKDYCVDLQRVFAVGFSYGGMFSYAIACELGGVFRAVAPMSGALLSGCKLSGKPMAMWASHGTSDSLVPVASGRQARDKILEQNHCGTETKPIDPSPCVAYQGCDNGYPVTWCEWDGDHNRPPFGNSAVAAFFKQF